MRIFELINQAFEITKNHRWLWFFGLFMTGAFPLYFLGMNSYLDKVVIVKNLPVLAAVLVLKPEFLFILSLGLLVFVLFGALTTNISRVVLIVAVGKLLGKVEKANLDNYFQFFRAYRITLLRVIFVSGLTTLLMLVSSLLVFLPFYWLKDSVSLLLSILPIGSLVLLFIGFIFSCLNLFAIMFIVFFKQDWLKSLNLAADLFHTRWIEIVRVGVILSVLHLCVVYLSRMIAHLTSLVLVKVIDYGVNLQLLTSNNGVLIRDSILGIIFWISAAIFSVFFNTVLVILFFKLLGDIENPEYRLKPVVQSAR